MPQKPDSEICKNCNKPKGEHDCWGGKYWCNFDYGKDTREFEPSSAEDVRGFVEKPNSIPAPKKYPSCDAPIGEFCKKHQCIHTVGSAEIRILKPKASKGKGE